MSVYQALLSLNRTVSVWFEEWYFSQQIIFLIAALKFLYNSTYIPLNVLLFCVIISEQFPLFSTDLHIIMISLNDLMSSCVIEFAVFSQFYKHAEWSPLFEQIYWYTHDTYMYIIEWSPLFWTILHTYAMTPVSTPTSHFCNDFIDIRNLDMSNKPIYKSYLGEKFGWIFILIIW